VLAPLTFCPSPHPYPTLFRSTAVSAFAGGDLISALVAFPRAAEITTISLELAGDPRALPTLTAAETGRELTELRREIGLLIANRSEEHTSEIQTPDHRVCSLP